MADLQLGLVEPKDAVAAFQKRKLLLPSFAWQDVFQDEHGRGFAVAGVQRLDILQAFQDEIDKAIKQGSSLAQFRDAIRPALTAKGYWGDVEVTDPDTGEKRITKFDDRRLRTVYDTNMRQSFAAGRWSRIEANRDTQPLIAYRTQEDEHVRASHRPWDWVVLPIDDPFWDTHFAPNGWGCRCYCFGISQRGLAKMQRAGVKVKTTAPKIDWITYVNPRTGEVVPVPRGIDPGFGYNPGKERDAELHEQILRKAMLRSPLASATAVAQAQRDYPKFIASTTRSFGRWVDDVLDAGKSNNMQTRHIGVMAPQIMRNLAAVGVEPASPVVSVRDVDVLHALRPDKAAQAIAITATMYRQLPKLLANPVAVLAEIGADPPAVLYVIEAADEKGRVAKLVIKLDVRVKISNELGRARVPMNVVRTATLLDPRALQDRVKYRLLWGEV